MRVRVFALKSRTVAPQPTPPSLIGARNRRHEGTVSPSLEAPRACLSFPEYDLAPRGLAASGEQSNSGPSNAFRSQSVEL